MTKHIGWPVVGWCIFFLVFVVPTLALWAYALYDDIATGHF